MVDKDKVPKLTAIINKLEQAKILTIGDIMLDEFIWGSVNRISPEAPVPVVLVKQETFMPGGSLNVAHNIKTLGGTVYPCGIVGRDLRGRMLLKMMRKEKVDCGGIVTDVARPTTLKSRIIAHSQHVVRFDRENTKEIGEEAQKKIIAFFKEKIEEIDTVIIEDYGKGVITPELLKAIVPLAKKFKKKIVVDPKDNHFSYYKGVTSITPNFKEAKKACGIQDGDEFNFEDIAKSLQEKHKLESVLLTLSEKGMLLYEKSGEATIIPTAAKEVYDVSGAGDTVIAIFSMAISVGASLKEAAELANFAAGIVVGKVGTACVSKGELEQAINSLAEHKGYK